MLNIQLGSTGIYVFYFRRNRVMSTKQKSGSSLSANSSKRPIPSAVLRQRIQVHQLEQMSHPDLCVACDNSKGNRKITWPSSLRRNHKPRESASSPLRLPKREPRWLSTSDNVFFIVFHCSEICTGKNSSRRGQSLSQKHSNKSSVTLDMSATRALESGSQAIPNC